MEYSDLYSYLRQACNYEEDEIRLDCNAVLRNYDFTSKRRFQQPSAEEGINSALPDFDDYDEELAGVQMLLNVADSEIAENTSFRYHTVFPRGVEKARGIILLLHGFNEKYWYKYLPWVAHIVEKTGKAVVMFPIAFHMNRAPSIWSDRRYMHRVCRERKKRNPLVLNSTLSNVAISTRLHNRPDRFIWSGLESYHDIIDLVETIKKGDHPGIDAEASIDFFSYSIGTFLGEVLMMTNKNGYFSKSRYATFCGGPVFNRLSPVSRFILDSVANVSLYSYLVEHLESHMAGNPQLGDFLGGQYEEGVNFRSLLNYRVNLKYREDKFRSFSDRFYAIALATDEVVPAYEVINTLQGSRKDIPIPVDVLDYPYPHSHEDPFPLNPKFSTEINSSFNMTFSKVCEFLQ